MSIFKRALEKQEWEVAALCLLLGTLEAAARLPREAVLRLVGVTGPSRSRRKGGRKG
ncbi:MAG: hypothetical protein ACE5JL_12985 [Dehalococcoidia bacterium]